MEDQSREGINIEKLLQCFRLLLPRNSKTLVRIRHFYELDLAQIQQAKGVELKGLILDVDGCLAPNHQDILPENIIHLKKLTDSGIKIVLYSNMIWTKRYECLDPNIEVLTNLPPKPNLAGFEIAISKLNLPKQNIAMLGDSYMTDAGAIRAGLHFIHVDPIPTPGDQNKIHDLVRNFFISLSKFYDRFN